MAHINVKDLCEGDVVEGFYAVKDASLQTTSTGKYYIRFLLSDASGSISGNMWDASQEIFQTFSAGSIVKIRAAVESYRGQLQIKIERLRVAADEDNIDLSIFVPHTPACVDELFDELKSVIAQLKDRDYKALLNSFFSDEEIVKKFRCSPAAKANHHAYIGGLLEHTVSMLRYARAFVLSSSANLNLELLLTGIILHDIGKIMELSVGVVIDYTDRGRLLGHLIIGVMMVEERVKNIAGFSPEKKMLIEHLILSHHGKYEYGSPVLPAVPEAFALHHIDNLDAKTNAACRFIAEDTSDDKWTERSWMLDTMLYKADCSAVDTEEMEEITGATVLDDSFSGMNEEEQGKTLLEKSPEIISGGLFD